MSSLRVNLTFDEGQALRDVVAGPPEVRLLGVLRNRFLVQLVRSDLGPVLDFPTHTRISSPRELRSLEAAKGVDRVVTIEVDKSRPASLQHLWQGLAEGSIRADPAWVPFLEFFLRLPQRLRQGLLWFLQDGTYAVSIRDEEADQSIVICAELEAGRVVALTGGEALGAGCINGELALAGVIQREVARPRLLLTGTLVALQSVVAAAHPASQLEYASIRGEVRAPVLSGRLRLGLLILRLFGL